jgi:hypothetical protein
MKFREDRPFADLEAAVKKLLELANGMAADHAGRLSVGILNTQFKDAGGSYPEYSAAVQAAIDRGYGPGWLGRCRAAFAPIPTKGRTRLCCRS